MRKKLLVIFQVLVSVGLLVWLFRREDLQGSLREVVLAARPEWLVAGFLIAGFGNFLGIYRWGIFVKMLGLKLTNRDVLRVGLIGLFFNNFLIGAIGGDAVKVVWLAARGERKAMALMSVGMDRMSGIPALVFCSLLFMTPRLEWLRQSPLVAGLTKAIFIYLLVIAALFLLSLVLARIGLTKYIPERGPGRAQMTELENAYRQFLEHPRPSLKAGGVSVFMFVTYFLTFYCAARAFEVQVPLGDFMAVMPTVDMVSALPVSVGGFGVREHLFTVLLGDLCQVQAAQAVAVSLTGALLTMVWGLGGLIVLPAYRSARSATTEVAP
ncbi:MAG TPA: lysylphosphatidylglycerol synthase transmembrane domain-containing protein [Chthoniobacterales bacterium]|jgi:hypothetical protein